MYRRSARLAAALALVSCVPLWAACAGTDVGEPDADCAFDRTAWATDPAQRSESTSAGSHGPTPRQREADTLIACGTLDHAPRDDVAALLGASDPADDSWVYVTGPDRGYGVDYEELVVEFGPDGTATRLFLRQG
jgi:hypothetical protein